MIHQLPTEAQIEGGDHVRVRRLTYHHSGGELSEVQVEVEYGTTDADGNFIARQMTPSREVIIRDIATFEGESFTGNAPDTRADPVQQGREAAVGFLDSHSLWPTS